MQRLSQAIRFALIAALSCAVSIAAFTYVPYLTVVERFFSDFRIATLLPPEPQDPDIVVAALTEDTLRLFPYRSPVDRRFLSDLLRTLEERQVKGILLDVLLDQPTEVAKDDELKATIRSLRVPLAISVAHDPHTVTPAQLDYLGKFVPPESRGLANMVTDSFDDVVRRVFPGERRPDGTLEPGVAAALTAKLGVEPPTERVSIAWHGSPDAKTKPFREFPAHAVKVLPAAWFKDKVVLIGAVLSLTDRHRSPFAAVAGGAEGRLPGIIIQAHIASQMLHHRPSFEVASWVGWALCLLLALLGVGLGGVDLSILLRIAVALGAVIAFCVGGFALFRYGGMMVPLVAPALALLLSFALADAYMGRQARQQRRFVKQAFSRYVSPALVDQLVADPSKLSLTGDRRELSLIFTDVAGFTTLSERLDPTVMTELLNEYLGGLCRIIDRHAGTVNKFIGDAVFAIFGAPLPQPDHASRALACMLEMDAFAEKFVAEQRERGVEFGLTRIGGHTGRAMIGNFGSESRFEYTALGDAVNTAARLEGLNKYFGTRLCVSGSLREQSGDRAFRPMGAVVLKGKTESIEVFEPLSAERAGSSFMVRYSDAFELLRHGDPRAAALFEALAREEPEDGCVALHLERIREGRLDAVIVMTDK